MSYGLYIAKIEGIASTGDTRLQVRILPEMSGLSQDYLPIWPFFFKHQTITGKVGELVWCIANTDFTTGYILGYVNSYTWGGNYEESSIPKTLFDKIDDAYVELRGRLLNYRDILVTFWNDDSIHFIERSTGAHIIAFTNGTISLVRPDEIIMAVGKKSMINMNSEEVTIVADKIRLSGEVRLGLNPQGSVLVTPGFLGKNGLPSRSVWA